MLAFVGITASALFIPAPFRGGRSIARCASPGHRAKGPQLGGKAHVRQDAAERRRDHERTAVGMAQGADKDPRCVRRRHPVFLTGYHASFLAEAVTPAMGYQGCSWSLITH
jgi:hypothetical protein